GLWLHQANREDAIHRLIIWATADIVVWLGAAAAKASRCTRRAVPASRAIQQRDPRHRARPRRAANLLARRAHPCPGAADPARTGAGLPPLHPGGFARTAAIRRMVLT